MSISHPVAQSFQETFCAQYGVSAELYGATVLRITLYPHARWLADVRPHSFLAADRSFVASVGRLTCWSGFADEARAFQRLPANRRFWRRGLCLRVSVSRMRALFSEVMGGTTSRDSHRAAPRDEARDGPGSLVMD